MLAARTTPDLFMEIEMLYYLPFSLTECCLFMYIDRLCSLDDVDVDASFLSPFSTVCDIGTGL